MTKSCLSKLGSFSVACFVSSEVEEEFYNENLGKMRWKIFIFYKTKLREYVIISAREYERRSLEDVGASRGKSGLHRAGWRLMTAEGDLRASATEMKTAGA